MAASVYSVEQVNRYIKNLFQQDFALRRIFVRGEISNCKYHSTGHIYFTLKDASGVLKAVMFRSQRAGLSIRLRDGMKVVAGGSITVYERDGAYQLYVQTIEADGVGALYQEYERRKQELEEMGMFAVEYKQQIPAFSRRIGVVTAETGAVIRDICNVAFRRNPHVEIILYPALVQGESAASSIAAGIRYLDEMHLDCMIIGRGGGSLEDLWAFNEEETAYAIFHAETPIISAVGHETDYTIADFVADLRAPTPSAAAELAVFDYDAYLNTLSFRQKQLFRALMIQIERKETQFEGLKRRLLVCDPNYQLERKREQLQYLESQLKQKMEYQMQEYRHKIQFAAGRLESLSPLKRLSGGYAYVSSDEGRPISSVSEAVPGQCLKLHFADGQMKVQVVEPILQEEQNGRTRRTVN